MLADVVKHAEEQVRCENDDPEKRDPNHFYTQNTHIVVPSKKDEFIKAWLEERDGVKKNEKNNVVYRLNKTKTDNKLFFTYGELAAVLDCECCPA